MLKEFFLNLLSYDTLIELISLIFVFGIVLIVMIVRSIIINRKFGQIAGTLHIDNSREHKTVYLFTIDLPLEVIEKKKTIVLKIDTKSHLKEWEE